MSKLADDWLVEIIKFHCNSVPVECVMLGTQHFDFILEQASSFLF
jgi:hypothetical protein